MITLTDAIVGMNANAGIQMADNPDLWIGLLAHDLAHWEESGITTAEGFYDYLDACVARDRQYGLDPDYSDSDEEHDDECEGCAECEDEHDGQPDEAQEWHDFDPDC